MTARPAPEAVARALTAMGFGEEALRVCDHAISDGYGFLSDECRDCQQAILQRLYHEAQREALEGVAKAGCAACALGDVPTLRPAGPREIKDWWLHHAQVKVEETFGLAHGRLICKRPEVHDAIAALREKGEK